MAAGALIAAVRSEEIPLEACMREETERWGALVKASALASTERRCRQRSNSAFASGYDTAAS